MFKALGNLLGNSSEESAASHWLTLENKEDIEDVITASSEKPQVIYKHSTRCATSFFALKNLQALESADKDRADYYMVDVIAQRSLSLQIAELIGVRHESPQLIILNECEVVWQGSHNQVQPEQITNCLRINT